MAISSKRVSQTAPARSTRPSSARPRSLKDAPLRSSLKDMPMEPVKPRTASFNKSNSDSSNSLWSYLIFAILVLLLIGFVIFLLKGSDSATKTSTTTPAAVSTTSTTISIIPTSTVSITQTTAPTVTTIPAVTTTTVATPAEGTNVVEGPATIKSSDYAINMTVAKGWKGQEEASSTSAKTLKVFSTDNSKYQVVFRDGAPTTLACTGSTSTFFVYIKNVKYDIPACTVGSGEYTANFSGNFGGSGTKASSINVDITAKNRQMMEDILDMISSIK